MNTRTLCAGIGVMLTVMALPTVAQKRTEKPKMYPGWKLVWADEFDKDGRPDPKNWTYETGFIRNEEAQWYQPDNATVKNGLLVIEARRERKKNPNYDPNGEDWKSKREYAEYTSSCLITQGLHTFTYGRFEMRGRIDTRSGVWPAFWTLGAQGDWPHGGEIDIMEAFRGKVLANFFWGSEKKWVPINRAHEKPIAEFPDKEWASKFHVWRMDWDKDSIKLYLDDALMNQVNLSETVNKDAEAKNPFHAPQYLLLNLAIGGQAGGDPSKTEFPAKLEVDYVRVYQKVK